MATQSKISRKDGESISDFYYRLEGGNNAKTQNEHLCSMNGALERCVKAGVCEYQQKPNESGTIHVYSFKKSDLPTFSTISQDVFNQNEIVAL